MKLKQRYLLINVPYHFHLLSGWQNTCWSLWLLPPRFQDTVKLELGQTTLLQKQIYPKQCLRLWHHGGHNQIKKLVKKTTKRDSSYLCHMSFHMYKYMSSKHSLICEKWQEGTPSIRRSQFNSNPTKLHTYQNTKLPIPWLGRSDFSD